jgi:CheY-like chemotaxis protein
MDEDVIDDAIEVSVIVVDYKMQDLDGLTLCDSVSNPYIKKILLTGAIPTNDAIEAFNRGLIQQFVSKADHDMVAKLEGALLKMQHAHFTEISNSIKTHAVGGWMPAFTDIKLLEYFQSLCNSLSVIEYYYHSNPTRFILVSKNASKNMLLLYTDDELDSHVESIKEGRFDYTVVSHS